MITTTVSVLYMRAPTVSGRMQTSHLQGAEGGPREGRAGTRGSKGTASRRGMNTLRCAYFTFPSHLPVPGVLGSTPTHPAQSGPSWFRLSAPGTVGAKRPAWEGPHTQPGRPARCPLGHHCSPSAQLSGWHSTAPSDRPPGVSLEDFCTEVDEPNARLLQKRLGSLPPRQRWDLDLGVTFKDGDGM